MIAYAALADFFIFVENSHCDAKEDVTFMDELAHDLSIALQESSKELQQTVRRYNRKRKGKVRRNSHSLVDDVSLYSVDFPNRSEASAGSDCEYTNESTMLHLPVNSHIVNNSNSLPNPPVLNSLLATVEATTDSEDQYGQIANKFSALKLPQSHTLVSGGDLESDSVNERCYEKKSTDHARRRRRAKLNASPSIGNPDSIFTPEMERKAKPRPHYKKKEVMDVENTVASSLQERRKSSQRMEAEVTSPSGSCGDASSEGNLTTLNADSLVFYESESSIPTSGAEETCDEQAGEADDEQSDFFHEFHDGPTYGIPIVRRPGRPLTSNTPDSFSLSHIPIANLTPSTSSFPLSMSLPNTKHKRTKYGKNGRPIRTGYRRLKHTSKAFPTPIEFTHDRMTVAPPVSFQNNEYKAAKRRRHVNSCHQFNDIDESLITSGESFSSSFKQSISDWPEICPTAATSSTSAGTQFMPNSQQRTGTNNNLCSPLVHSATTSAMVSSANRRHRLFAPAGLGTSAPLVIPTMHNTGPT